MRPGRLDRVLWVGPPDQQGREEILRIKTKKMTVGPELNVKIIAELVRLVIWISDCMVDLDQAEGCSGAEISSLCQEAAILTMQENMNAPHVCLFPGKFFYSEINLCAIRFPMRLLLLLPRGLENRSLEM